LTPPTPPRVLVPLATGVEEMEAVILIDVLRRAGWAVRSAGLMAGHVTASRRVVLVPDVALETVSAAELDLLVLPGGGPGTEVLMHDERVLALARGLAAAGKPVAAICAAPRVLDRAGLLAGKRYTCFPGVESRIGSGLHVGGAVVADGLIHTSQGPGTAFAFALHLVEVLDSPEKAARLRQEMCL
jgi:protein deglycase